MTDCNLGSMRFPSCKGRLVAASFSGGAITFDGGAVLLRQADRMPGLAGRVARSLTDTRHKAICRHSLLTIVWQRPRRVIVKPGGRAAVGVYCACGDRENRIKEQQFDVFTGRTSAVCHSQVTVRPSRPCRARKPRMQGRINPLVQYPGWTLRPLFGSNSHSVLDVEC